MIELVVELRYPLSVLSSPDIELALNRAGHGLPLDRVAALLRGLLDGGLIAVETEGGASVDPSREELAALFALPEQSVWPADAPHVYGLTPAGGAAWEEIARPDWTLFVNHGFGVDPDAAEVICVERSRVEAFVYSRYQPCPPIAGSERWDTLVPWQVTYWKTLPIGHRVRYFYDSNIEQPGWHSLGEGEAYGAWCSQMYDWFKRIAPGGPAPRAR